MSYCFRINGNILAEYLTTDLHSLEMRIQSQQKYSTMKQIFLILTILLSGIISEAKANARVFDSIRDSYKQTSRDSFTENYAKQLSKSSLSIARLFNNSDSLTEQLRFKHNELYSSANILNGDAPDSEMMLYIFDVMTSFKTGVSIWDSTGNKTTSRSKEAAENNYKMRLSLGSTIHGAGLKLKF